MVDKVVFQGHCCTIFRLSYRYIGATNSSDNKFFRINVVFGLFYPHNKFSDLGPYPPPPPSSSSPSPASNWPQSPCCRKDNVLNIFLHESSYIVSHRTIADTSRKHGKSGTSLSIQGQRSNYVNLLLLITTNFWEILNGSTFEGKCFSKSVN